MFHGSLFHDQSRIMQGTGPRKVALSHPSSKETSQASHPQRLPGSTASTAAGGGRASLAMGGASQPSLQQGKHAQLRSFTAIHPSHFRLPNQPGSLQIMTMLRILITGLSCLLIGSSLHAAEPIKVGLIGLDTSHVIAFTRILNDSSHPDHVPGARVIAAFKGGSPDVESSRTRIDRFTSQLENEFGIKLIPSISELCHTVDAILLESVDGRPHLAQAKEVIRSGKPLFIDKPVAGSLRDALEIYRLAQEANVPCFSSSSYRFYPSLKALQQADIGTVRGAISYGPCHLEPHHPDLYWYGVHPTEALFTILGTGCLEVSRIKTPETDVVSGRWTEDRTGVLYGLRTGRTPHKVIAFGEKGVAEQGSGGGYAPLVQEIVEFFQTKQPPVSMEETIEMFAFMEAADESHRQGGKPVLIADLIRQHGGSWFLSP